MITFVRTVSIAPGKLAEIMEFSHKVVKHVKATSTACQSRPIMPIGRVNADRIAYVTTYPSLAEFEAASTKLTTDADYQKLVAANAANVIPGSVHDEIWRSL